MNDKQLHISFEFKANSLLLYPNLKIKMEFNEFVRNRNNCYIAEMGFCFGKYYMMGIVSTAY